MKQAPWKRFGVAGAVLAAMIVVAALARRDYTVLMALLMVASTTVIVLNLVADVVYPLIDPRVRA